MGRNESAYDSITTEELESRIAQQALFAMDACNLSGVVFAYARVMEDICELGRRKGEGTEFKNNHPAAVLFTEKVASLTRLSDSAVFSKAYDWCISKATQP